MDYQLLDYQANGLSG